jgi:Tol biopolymer transport system component
MDPDWGADLYRSELQDDGTYGSPAPLRVNSTGDESNVAMSPDGQFLVFQAYRDATAPGGEDLYVSRRNEYGWDAPVLLPAPFNSSANEGYPSFSPGGRFFLFASDRGARAGYYDIWYVDADALHLDDLTRRP